MVQLCEADKISYLANVFAICGADSRFSPQEVVVLRDVARRLNVSQMEATAARNLVASGHYELALLSEGRARRDNMEDMVMAVLANGELRPEVSAPIEKLAKTLRYAQVDMDMIARRAQIRLDTLLKASRDTDKKRPSPASATVASASSVRPPMPKEPSAASAPQPVPQEVTDSGAEEAEPSAPPETPSPPALPDDITACIRCRAAAQDEEVYCYGESESMNVWGCRLLRQPWLAGATWLKAGAFRPSGCFAFDREAIRALLVQAAVPVRCCPHFDPDAVERAVAALPSLAWPGRCWVLRSPEAGESGTPLTVRRYRQGCVMHARQVVGGVAPVGERLARRIIRDARRNR
ncbi:MAG TPA: hypothetical protein P5026_01885 [Kiritimatiellia bacterium]|nr:hypothetical protein [Kiritimatiellia bacterium]HRU69860.1 hypothetical protein [Kiritimatiellia bacterium]